MDAVFEKVAVAFGNVEDLLVDILKKKDVATKEEDRKRLNEVEKVAESAYRQLTDLRITVKKNL
jgi:hypothetical protein